MAILTCNENMKLVYGVWCRKAKYGYSVMIILYTVYFRESTQRFYIKKNVMKFAVHKSEFSKKVGSLNKKQRFHLFLSEILAQYGLL